MSAGADIRVFPTSQQLAEEAGRFVRAAARQAVADQGRFAVALSGGQTPQALYALLAEAGPEALPYDRMEVFWSDERVAPPGDEDSNYRVAWEAWLARMPLDARQVHRVHSEAGPDAAAARYEEELRRVLGDPPRFDLILLGIGTDGHTASLFPHAPALRSRRLVETTTAPTPPRQRVTFTFRVINAAARVLVLATGGEKTQTVRRALEDPPSPGVPASLLRRPEVMWFLDEAAASALRRPAEPPPP